MQRKSIQVLLLSKKVSKGFILLHRQGKLSIIDLQICNEIAILHGNIQLCSNFFDMFQVPTIILYALH